MSRHFRTQDEYEKDFVGIVDQLSYSRQKWEVWSDLMTVMACSLSNSVIRTGDRFERREKEYLGAIRRIGNADAAAKALAVIVEALESNPDQDFLGALYMRLELGSHWHGQFFTPYSLCQLMAEIEMPDPKAEVERRGWISICDPCIGGGAMMIAAANHLKRKNVNYHHHVLFVGQDIDRVAGMMAYIQLSLLGCPGYIAIANTLTNPLAGDALIPVEKEGQEFWYTPFYYADTWEYRRRFRIIQRMTEGAGRKRPVVHLPEKYTFFFDFRKEEEDGRTKEQPAACCGEIAG